MYTFYDLTKHSETQFDLKNCTITGNRTAYTIHDGIITKYTLENGKIDSESKEVVQRIELTNYQLSFLNLLKDKDGDTTVLNEADLKDLTSEQLQQEINAIYNKTKIYTAISANTGKDYAEIQITDNKSSEKQIGIEFETKGFFSRMKDYVCSWFKKETPECTNVAVEKLFDNRNFTIHTPQTYTANGSVNPIKLANSLGISYYRLDNANPNGDAKRELNDGMTINIPATIKIKKGSIKSIADIARILDIPENYIQDILFDIEGRNSEPALRPYYDGVATTNNKKGTLTIGFGHTGRIHGVEMNSRNKDSITITKDEAYEILAQDILNAKLDAIEYFGSDFLAAPKSIQAAIIDIIFNKGVDLGLNGTIGSKKFDSPTQNLKEDLRQGVITGSYAKAAEDVIYATKLKGLKKRNVYRAIMALKDLSENDRNKAIEKLEPYVLNTINMYNGAEKDTIANAWQNAKLGICEGFITKH